MIILTTAIKIERRPGVPNFRTRGPYQIPVLFQEFSISISKNLATKTLFKMYIAFVFLFCLKEVAMFAVQLFYKIIN